MDYYADIGTTILFLVILSVSLNLLLGYTGEVSMAHATFYGIGAYTAGLLTLPVGIGISSRGVSSGAGWSIYPATAVAVVVAFVLAGLISIPAISRVRGEYLILLTLAFQLVANQLMNSLENVTGGPYGITPIPPISVFGTTLLAPHQAFWALLVVTVLVVVVAWGLGESPFGRILKGIREHETAVRALGKQTVLPKVIIFSLAAGMAGLAGALNAYYVQFVAPGTYNLDLSILVVAIVVLGGVGNLTGTIVAAIVLGSLKPILQQVVGDNAIPWQAVIYGLALVVLVRFRPQGLVPEGAGIVRGLRSLVRAVRPVRPNVAAVPSPVVGTASAPVVSLEVARPAHTPPEERNAVLRVEGLSKRFGGLQAVSDVTFDLREQLITALIGPNGAGKTTLFNLMTGMLRPDEGRVLLHDRDVTNESPVTIARAGMARTFQDVRNFQRLSVLDNVAMAVPGQPGESASLLLMRPLRSVSAERQTRERAREALDFVGLGDRSDEIVGSLSFGDQKLVAIARVLATDCSILLLDEATSGIDPWAVEDVIQVILRLKTLGRTTCLIEHSLHFVERLADHAIFLDQGRVIAQGSFDELTRQEHLAEIYFGT